MADKPVYADLHGIAPARRAFDQAFTNLVYRLIRFIASHWLAMFNVLVGLFAGLPVLAPYLASLGHQTLAGGIYFIYLATGACHQMPERSFFLWGYKMAYCQRDTAIFTSVFIAGIFFALVRPRLRPLDWRLYLLLMAPLAIDGSLQLIGLYESTWEMRVFTGLLFGAANIWFIYPQIDVGMQRLRTNIVK